MDELAKHSTFQLLLFALRRSVVWPLMLFGNAFYNAARGWTSVMPWQDGFLLRVCLWILCFAVLVRFVLSFGRSPHRVWATPNGLRLEFFDAGLVDVDWDEIRAAHRKGQAHWELIRAEGRLVEIWPHAYSDVERARLESTLQGALGDLERRGRDSDSGPSL